VGSELTSLRELVGLKQHAIKFQYISSAELQTRFDCISIVLTDAQDCFLSEQLQPHRSATQVRELLISAE